MKTILYAIFMLFYSLMAAQVAVMPAHTKAAIEVIQKELNQQRNTLTQKTIDFYPIYKVDGEQHIAVLCKVNSSFNKEEAIRNGFDVGTIIGSIATMRIPIHMLTENFSFPGIEYIEVAEKVGPELDEALKDTRANLVHKGENLPQAYTGKGVIIGVVDWGFDYTHPMFFDTTLDHTRILASWDQVKVVGTPPEGYNHGAVYIGAEELALAEHDTVSPLTDYHGTHVAGIAGGSGGGTTYRGTGFESDLLFSQMRNDVSSSIDAFQWMTNMAQDADKRLVINNSWGNYRLFPLDGTSLMSQAIDAFTDQGTVIVFSAGNNGNISFHLKKEFNSDSVRTWIQGFSYNTDPDLWGQAVSMWGEPGNPFSVQLRILNTSNEILAQSDLINTASAEAYLDTMMIIGADTVFYHVTTDAAHPLNGRPQMTLDIQSRNGNLRKVLYAEAPSGTVHFWNTRLTTYGIGNWGYGFTAPTVGYVNGDKKYGIGHPALTESAITCAAHQTNFHLTSFSSSGPRMDEVIKPDISAPGQDIISSFNSFSSSNFNIVATTDFNGKEYEFVRLSGTSMSAPMVTGAVALILEADPNLTTAEVKEILIESAREDGLTGQLPPEGDLRWGHGKLDIYTAIQDITTTATGQVTEVKGILYPNPAQDRVFVSITLRGDESFQLISPDGRLMSSGHFDGSLAVGEMPTGMYTLIIKSAERLESYRIVVGR